MSHKVTLWPSTEVLEVSGDQSLLEELKKAGKKIKSSCGGHATCSDCIIKVKGGESSLTPPTFEELRLLGNIFHITKERLACQTKLTGDAVIDISAHTESKATPKTQEAAVSKGPKTLIKKRETLQESALKSQEKDSAKKDGDWYRHWDSTEKKDHSRPKNLGGNKRPKPFREIKDAPHTPDEGDE